MFVTYRLIVLLIPQNRNSFSAIPMQHCSNMKSGTLSVEQAVNTILFQAICASKNRARNKRCALCRQCSKYGNMRNTRPNVLSEGPSLLLKIFLENVLVWPV